MTLQLAICAAFLIGGGTVQDKDEKEPFVAMKPSAEHDILKMDLGTWDIKITMGSGPEAMHSKGVETVTMLGPFWNVSTMKYDYMGQPVTSKAIMGYDPDKKKYTGTYHESSSPYITTMEGTWNAKARKMTLMMKGKSPEGKDTRFKAITTYTNDTSKSFEFFMLEPGSDTKFIKAMEMQYTLRKAVKKANEN